VGGDGGLDARTRIFQTFDSGDYYRDLLMRPCSSCFGMLSQDTVDAIFDLDRLLFA
jgi:hypothetical protein